AVCGVDASAEIRPGAFHDQKFRNCPAGDSAHRIRRVGSDRRRHGRCAVGHRHRQPGGAGHPRPRDTQHGGREHGTHRRRAGRRLGHGARRHHRLRRISGRRQPQDRRGLDRTALRARGREALRHRPRADTRPGEARARIQGRKAGPRARRVGQARTPAVATQVSEPLPLAPHPSRKSLKRLDWFVFLVADVQTGFGPFVAVYLTSQKWTQIEIGLVLTVAGLVSLLGQIPGGALVDAVRSERVVAAVAVTMIAMSALVYATLPIFPAVLVAATLQAAASCVLGPAIAAISLGLVGHAAIGERFGRNARFASIGAALSAAVMGGFGYFFSPQAVFFVTAALLLPTLLVLRGVAAAEIDPERAHGNMPEQRSGKPPVDLRSLLSKRALLVFGCCILLFHLPNAAMLPLMGSVLTTRSSQWATVLIGACMVGPQIVVALFSPWVGRQAQRIGRKPLLIAGFAA